MKKEERAKKRQRKAARIVEEFRPVGAGRQKRRINSQSAEFYREQGQAGRQGARREGGRPSLKVRKGKKELLEFHNTS